MNCPNCGANVPEDATHCPTCGREIERDHRREDHDRVIDVSGDRPELVREDERTTSGGFVSEQIGHARVYVARGNQRSCLIPIAVVLLLLCCACVGFWGVVDSVF